METFVASKDCDLIYTYEVLGGRLIIKYGTQVVCQCDYPLANKESGKTYPFQPSNTKLSIIATDTDSKYQCIVKISIFDRVKKQELLVGNYSFKNPLPEVAGNADGIDLNIQII